MSETFEQGWAAKSFKDQFPELSDQNAKWLDNLNMSITDMLLADLITQSACDSIRHKKFPKLVTRFVLEARKEKAKADALQSP